MVVSATPNRTHQTIVEKINQKRKSFNDMGMNMEESKTKVLIVNGSQSIMKSPTGDISPKASIKSLGYHVQTNLKIEKTVKVLVSKINQRFGRIWQFPNLPLKCKITLYYA